MADEKKTTSIKTKKTLKDKVIESLGVTEQRDINRYQGGVCKFIDLGIINSELVIPDETRPYNLYDKETKETKTLFKNSRVYSIKKRDTIKAVKNKLKKDLGEDYKYLTIETRLFKPKFGSLPEKQEFKIGIYVYGEDFPKIIRKVGNKKNVRYIHE